MGESVCEFTHSGLILTRSNEMSNRKKVFSIWQAIYFFIMGLLPSRGKRIILLTTLYMQLVEKGVFHEEALAKLNRVLCLASTNEALILPSSMSTRIWDSKDLLTITNKFMQDSEGISCLAFTEAKRVSDEILDLAPSCLKYATHEEMLNDVIALFYCQPVRTA